MTAPVFRIHCELKEIEVHAEVSILARSIHQYQMMNTIYLYFRHPKCTAVQQNVDFMVSQARTMKQAREKNKKFQ